MSKPIARSKDGLQPCSSSKADRVVIALWFILGVWGWSWLGPVWLKAMRPEPDRINDFYQDWGSARNYWVGLPIYTHHATSIPRHLGLPSNPVPSIEYNAHPPTSVLLALPLGRLSYPNAVLVWNVISLVALGASLKIVATELAFPRRLLPPTLALMAFCHPIYGNVYQGQLTLILVLLVTAIWALERSGWSYSAGLLLVLPPRSSCSRPTWLCITPHVDDSGRSWRCACVPSTHRADRPLCWAGTVTMIISM